MSQKGKLVLTGQNTSWHNEFDTFLLYWWLEESYLSACLCLFNRPQTKFGARSCFYTCRWFCSQVGCIPACSGTDTLSPWADTPQTDTPSDTTGYGQTSGWYASYWNAYLCSKIMGRWQGQMIFCLSLSAVWVVLVSTLIGGGGTWILTAISEFNWST